MKRRKGKFLRRAGAWVLSAALSVPLALSYLPPMEAKAAGVALSVKLVDDDTGSGIPQGLGRMEARDIGVYDVTELYEQEHVMIQEQAVFERVMTTDENRKEVAEKDNAGRDVYRYVGYRYSEGYDYDVQSKGYATKPAYEGIDNTLYYREGNDSGLKPMMVRARESYPNGAYIMQYVTKTIHGTTHSYSGCRIDTNNDGKPDSWSTACIQAHGSPVGAVFGSRHDASGTTLVTDDLTTDHVYVVVENDNKRVSAYCYAPNLYDGTRNTFYHEIEYGNILSYGTIPDSGEPKYKLDESDRIEHNTSEVTLRNKIWRGGFSFQVKDVETELGTLQSMGMPQWSIFAVFNISDSALAPDAYEDIAEIKYGKDPQIKDGAKADPTQYGKVRVATNGYSFTYGDINALSDPLRAYSYEDVMKAYEAYLSDSWNHTYDEDQLDVMKYVDDSDAIRFYNGMYGYGKYKVQTAFSMGDIRSGLFTLGQDSKGADIVPCAMLSADASGTVSTGAGAFPAGNYLVLQVRSAPGYYIDENFRMAVSIGPWFNGYDLDNTSQNGNPYERISSGYGNALFNQFSYTLRDTSSLAAKEFDNSNRFKNVAGVFRLDKYPAAYVPATASSTGVAEISTEGCSGFGVNSTGAVTGSGVYDAGRGLMYRTPTDSSDGTVQGMGNEGRYIIAPSDGTASSANGVGTRRYPKAGMSRLTAWMAPVRAGVSFKLTDAYDLQEFKKANGGDKAYMTSPQGDARLEGAVFRLYHDRGNGDGSNGSYVPNNTAGSGREAANYGFTTWLGIPGTGGAQSITNNTNNTWVNHSGSYKEYTSIKLPNGEYIVNIPVDDLVYGEYTLVQVAGGDGYGTSAKNGNEWAGHREEELTAWVLRVVGEDTVYVRYAGKELNDKDMELTPLSKETIEKHTVNGTVYLPQTPYIGEGAVSVTVLGGDADGVSAQVSVYNISDSHIYIGSGYDESGNFVSGREVKTAQSMYKSGIEGKPNINMDTLKTITSGAGWSDSRIWSGTINAGEAESDSLKDLPYGTYLAAVTGVTGNGDYMPTTGAAAVFQVRPGGIAVCSIILGDKARIPLVSGELLDGTTGTKSVMVGLAGLLNDNITLGNLQPDTKYAIYGMLVDTATGNIVPGTKVATAQASGYVSSGNGTGAPGDTSLANLVVIGQKFSDGEMDFENNVTDYMLWLKSVQDLIGHLDDSVTSKAEIKNLVDQMAAVPPVIPWTKQNHGYLMGQLKYLLNNAGDAGLAGTADIAMQFSGADTRSLEGHVLAAYVFVCEDTSVNQTAAAALTLSDLQKALVPSTVAMYGGANVFEQAAYVPSLTIEATGARNGGHLVDPSDAVKADLAYGNLEANVTYRLEAWIMDSEGMVLRSPVDPTQDMVAVRDFTAQGVSGKLSVVFDEVDLSDYDGQRLTVYGKLSRIVSIEGAANDYAVLEKGSAETMGWTPGVESPGINQVDITAPGVYGVLTDAYGYKETDFSVSTVSLKNTVTYEGLVPGQRYEAVSYLKYPDGSDVMAGNGQVAAGWTQFTARSTTYSAEVKVEFDGRKATDKTVVAFNDLYSIEDGGRALSAYVHDLHNVDQTVTDSNPGGRVYLQVVSRDDGTKTQYATVSTSAPQTISVQVQGLDAGASYVLKVQMADAGNGQAVPQSEEKVVQVRATDGGMVNTDVKVSLNTSILTGRTLTAYVTVLDASGYDTIAEFNDNADTAAQIYVPALAAQLTGADGKAKTVWPEKVEDNKTNVTVGADGELKTDVTTSYRYDAKVRVGMSYGNLVAGNPYTVKITVSPKDGGGALATYDGAFSPENASGDAYFDFTVDVTKYMEKDLVATLVLTDDYTKRTVLQLTTTDDPARTVHVAIPGSEGDPNKPTGSGNSAGTGSGNSAGTKPGTGGSSSGSGGSNGGAAIQTGVDERYGLYFALSGILAVLAAGIGGFVFLYKRKGAFWRR